jgi:hypothetical protein
MDCKAGGDRCQSIAAFAAFRVETLYSMSSGAV